MLTTRVRLVPPDEMELTDAVSRWMLHILYAINTAACRVSTPAQRHSGLEKALTGAYHVQAEGKRVERLGALGEGFRDEVAPDLREFVACHDARGCVGCASEREIRPQPQRRTGISAEKQEGEECEELVAAPHHVRSVDLMEGSPR